MVRKSQEFGFWNLRRHPVASVGAISRIFRKLSSTVKVREAIFATFVTIVALWVYIRPYNYLRAISYTFAGRVKMVHDCASLPHGAFSRSWRGKLAHCIEQSLTMKIFDRDVVMWVRRAKEAIRMHNISFLKILRLRENAPMSGRAFSRNFHGAFSRTKKTNITNIKSGVCMHFYLV